MTSEQLSHLQDFGSLLLLVFLALGVVHLCVGLVRPHWVWRKGRFGVVLMSLGFWVLAFVIYGGIIGYTHSHPNGPHSFKGYLDDYIASECAAGADLPGCKKDGAVAPLTEATTP